MIRLAPGRAEASEFSKGRVVTIGEDELKDRLFRSGSPSHSNERAAFDAGAILSYQGGHNEPTYFNYGNACLFGYIRRSVTTAWLFAK
jgi:hypothetical protein